MARDFVMVPQQSKWVMVGPVEGHSLNLSGLSRALLG